jgi:hypothetical protein
MIRVVPSHIVSVIEQLFPAVITQETFQLKIDDTAALTALLALVDQVPQELFPATSEQYSALMIALATLRNAPAYWSWYPRLPIVSTPGGYSKNPVQLLYDTLKTCPDDAPTPETTDLSFIPDLEFREGLRLDISTASQALANQEWKAATVLAGSVVEALLWWALQQETPTDLQQAITAAMAQGTLPQRPPADVDRWGLAQYITVAEQLKKITADTATQAGLAKDFRNLIHPGKAQRQAQACTRGTAMAALAAVEMVIECLTP